MNSLDAYRIFLGIKSHFTKLDYNYKKYGKIKAKIETFEKRNDRFYFIKLAKEYSNENDLILFYVSNLYYNPNMWIGEMIHDDAKKRYTERKKIQESIEYSFKNEIDSICLYLENNNLHFNDLFEVKNPVIIKLLDDNIISPETYCIMNMILNFHDSLAITRKNDPLWEEKWLKLKKMEYMIDSSKKYKFKNIIKDKISSCALTK